jgi:hypothetical protein
MSPLLGNVTINRLPIIEQPEFSVKRGPFLGYKTNVIAVSTGASVLSRRRRVFACRDANCNIRALWESDVVA